MRLLAIGLLPRHRLLRLQQAIDRLCKYLLGLLVGLLTREPLLGLLGVSSQAATE